MVKRQQYEDSPSLRWKSVRTIPCDCNSSCSGREADRIVFQINLSSWEISVNGLDFFTDPKSDVELRAYEIAMSFIPFVKSWVKIFGGVTKVPVGSIISCRELESCPELESYIWYGF
jgi:hypothetical protein